MSKGVEDGCVVVTVLFKYLPTGAGPFWELFVVETKPEVGFGWAVVVFQKWLVLLCARPRLSEETIAMRAEKRIANGVKTKPREISGLGQWRFISIQGRGGKPKVKRFYD
jgi:hypothetical protein